MKKTSAPSKAITSAIAISLAMTMNPAAALAVDTGVSSAADAAENPEIESTVATEAQLPVAEADVTDQSRIRENAVEDDAAANVVSATVAIAQEAPAVIVVQHDGMRFQVEDGIATLVGIAPQSAGELNIPESIEADGVACTVTNIGTNLNLGGGVRPQCAFRGRAFSALRVHSS